MIIRSVKINRKELSLVDESYSKERNNYTILVGSNGTGKSRMLRRIVNGIRNNNLSYKTVPIKYGKHAEIEYEGDVLSIYSSSSETNSYIRTEKSDMDAKNIDCNVIAVTTTPFDKFPVPSRANRLRWIEESENYKYIGLKVSKNSLNESNLVDLLAKSMMTSSKIFENKKLFSLLGLTPECIVNFKSKMSLFCGFDSYSEFCKEFKQKNVSLYHYSDGDNNFLREVYSAYQDYSDLIKDTYYRPNGAEFIGFSLSSHNLPVSSLIYLIDLGVVSVQKVSFLDSDSKLISLSDLSSGQKCMILTLLNISGAIRDGSIICIDEPELSLHPKWQMRYMKVLIEFFKDFKKCHFIIATHSPLIISELSSENCFVLNIDEGVSKKSTDYQHMSSDFQLVEVFGMAGNNNEYLNRIVVTLLSKLSRYGSLDKDDQKKLKKLRDVSEQLDEQDDVKVLINLLFESWKKVSK
ncbi:ATP-binding protein [Marinomonas hwangdonensis]|uniref:ATP-binding protein n=1 Tax=Marinomonas hwangdonensis TaxID=1053647 RepID=A0A3M8Q7Y7_9GAMM|nr:ATP-binding protein [Marinomonas hwangdonensis]RNF52188.1 ATP-binding protein [Marinomonas hwangdonensis]